MEWFYLYIITEFEAKHPQLEPLPIVTDPEALENAKPQTAISRVFVGGANGPHRGW